MYDKSELRHRQPTHFHDMWDKDLKHLRHPIWMETTFWVFRLFRTFRAWGFQLYSSVDLHLSLLSINVYVTITTLGSLSSSSPNYFLDRSQRVDSLKSSQQPTPQWRQSSPHISWASGPLRYHLTDDGESRVVNAVGPCRPEQPGWTAAVADKTCRGWMERLWYSGHAAQLVFCVHNSDPFIPPWNTPSPPLPFCASRASGVHSLSAGRRQIRSRLLEKSTNMKMKVRWFPPSNIFWPFDLQVLDNPKKSNRGVWRTCKLHIER